MILYSVVFFFSFLSFLSPTPPRSFCVPSHLWCTVGFSPWCRSCVLLSWQRQRQRESCWQLRAQAARLHWLHDRESKTQTGAEREREREGREREWEDGAFFPSPHQLGIIRPTVAWYICPTCLPIIFFYLCLMSLSSFFSICYPPSVSFGSLPTRAPLQLVYRCVRACTRATVCM